MTTTTKGKGTGWSASVVPLPGGTTARVRVVRMIRQAFGFPPVPAEDFRLVFRMNPATEAFDRDEAERLAADINEGGLDGFLIRDGFRLDPEDADTGRPGSFRIGSIADRMKAEQAVAAYQKQDRSADFRYGYRDGYGLDGKKPFGRKAATDKADYDEGHRDGSLLRKQGFRPGS